MDLRLAVVAVDLNPPGCVMVRRCAADPELLRGRGPNQRVRVKWPSFIAPPQACIEDIIPDMFPEYVPVIVRPSFEMVACPPIPKEQGDIMPLKAPFGTAIWNVTVEPLMVPCIEPFPIMFLSVSLMFIVPVMALPFWVSVQLIFA
jgi:hypothetical protein